MFSMFRLCKKAVSLSSVAPFVCREFSELKQQESKTLTNVLKKYIKKYI